MSTADQVEEEAVRWLVRRGETGWTSDDQAQLDAWLERSDAHRLAYWRAEFGALAIERASLDAAGMTSAPSLRYLKPTFPQWAVAAGLVLGIAAVSAYFIQAGPFSQIKTYATVVGGHETLPLADGSRVELNTASRMRASLTRDLREVWLDDGEAYFEVYHDEHRPFVVHAGKHQVNVLGTKFSVRRTGDDIEVIVAQGRVRVENHAGPTVAPLIVSGNQAAQTKGGSVMLVTGSAEQIVDRLSWREGRLVFDNVALKDVVGEFNRYNNKRLSVSQSAADVRISGSFEAENIDAFTRLLRAGFGLKIENKGETIKITS